MSIHETEARPRRPMPGKAGVNRRSTVPAPGVPRTPKPVDVRATATRAIGDTEADVLDAGNRFRVGVAPAPAVRTDYRMRGLDLGATALAEASRPAVHKAHPSQRRLRRRRLVQLVVVLALAAATAAALRSFVVQPYSVHSTSMVPTIQPGTDVLVLRPQAMTGALEVGDVVLFQQPDDAHCAGGPQTLINRVIGLPGQTIWSAHNHIYVDDRVLRERGWFNPPFGELGPTGITRTTIAAGSYFLMGDNRTDRCDSRAFGAVPRSSLIGKVVATTARGGHPYVHIL